MSPNRLFEIKEDSKLIDIVISSSYRELTVQKPVAKQPGLLESKTVFFTQHRLSYSNRYQI
jgi:hypothetical protein